MELDTEITTNLEEEPRLVSKKATYSLRVAFMAIMTALVTIVTFYMTIPITPTGGYFNVGEGIIYITAILFGPFIGAFAGGVGASMADLFLGFGNFAPITLVVKSIEGFVVGFVFRYLKKRNGSTLWKKTAAILLGIPILVLGYFIGEYYILGQGPVAYLEIPWNLIQGLGGLIIALPLIAALERITFLKDQDVFS